MSCTEAVIEQATLTATHNMPAEFNLSEVGSGNTCTATETPTEGYEYYSYYCENEATPPDSTSTCYIYNYYLPVTVDVRAAALVREPDIDGAFDLVLSGNPPWGGLDVYVGLSGTATSGADYEAIKIPVNVPFGNRIYRVPVSVIDDDLIEETEDIVLTVLEDQGADCQEGLQSGPGPSKKQDNGCREPIRRGSPKPAGRWRCD